MKKKIDYKQDLIEEVRKDFLNRLKLRKGFEAIWRLNTNFLLGNQYCYVSSLNQVEETDKTYFWQQREVFNHIAPIIETRLSKLATVRPNMEVLPVSSEERDLKVAKLTKDIIKSVYDKLNLKEVISKVTKWSEITGTGFYKIVWNKNLGKSVYLKDNEEVTEGEVEVCAVSPYEIFPDNNYCGSLEECFSLIHAKAYEVNEIKNIWGVDVEPEDVETVSFATSTSIGGFKYKSNTSFVTSEQAFNSAIVIERYEAPSTQYKNGRLVIVCQNKLLYCGDLPYVNLYNNKRGFPFVRQVSSETPGCFWGSSVIERLIPVQRAYNAVKNRKHEYLNRLTMGVLTVEDGSVDISSLEEEGLTPGKVLVYRQGSNEPKMMQTQTLPVDFEKEEERLLEEFAEISGVSNIFTKSSWSNNLSGTALELMVEQDSARLSDTTEKIKGAVTKVAKQILKLYKQFAVTPRLININNSNLNSAVYYWKNSDLEEVELISQNEMGESLSSQREQILKLMDAGLLGDNEGKTSNAMRVKILELFGLGVWEGNTDESVLQKNYADDENLSLINGETEVEVLEIDNHELHISRHICFMLDKEFKTKKKKDKTIQQKFLNHIREHKKFLGKEREVKE